MMYFNRPAYCDQLGTAIFDLSIMHACTKVGFPMQALSSRKSVRDVMDQWVLICLMKSCCYLGKFFLLKYQQNFNFKNFVDITTLKLLPIFDVYFAD